MTNEEDMESMSYLTQVTSKGNFQRDEEGRSESDNCTFRERATGPNQNQSAKPSPRR